MRTVIDKILWGALIVLFGPTVIIVASWNSLPGDKLYSVKRSLERAMIIAASPSYASTGALQIKYTERRLAETKQLLASRQSVEGLPYLTQQIAETKRMIVNAPNKQTQVALAKQYLTTLSTVSSDLETQKQAVTSNSLPQLPPSDTAKPNKVRQYHSPTPTTRIPVPTNTPTPNHTPAPPSAAPSRPSDASAQSAAPSVAQNSPTSTVTLAPTPTKAQVAITAPISTGQAMTTLQINQTQEDVKTAIADLNAIVAEESDRSGDDRRQDRNKPKNEDQKEKPDKEKTDKEEKNNRGR